MESAIILTIFYLILIIPSIVLLFILKNDRKNYFLISSIYTILTTFLFFKFGANLLEALNIKTGTINYTIYLYKYLFMFSPLLALFFTSVHKLLAQKKQLIILIALKYFLPIFLYLIFMNFLPISKLLWLLAFCDITTTIISFLIAIIHS